MKVSVIMVTYNQDRYISQAIDGVLLQQADFPIELIIGEDCSPDNTRDIVLGYQEKYPDRIKAILHPSNIGGAENFRSIYNGATGDYIAMCEGDDYWTDPLKLAKQVAFLEQHADFSFSFHNVNVLDQHTGSSRPHFAPHAMPPQLALNTLLGGNFIQSCSVVYRRKNVPLLPDWLQSLPIGDWPLHILHAEKGPFGYIDEIMGVYRILSSGSWAKHPLAYRIERSIKTALMLDGFLGHKYTAQLSGTAVKWYNNLIDGYQKDIEPLKAFHCMLEAVDAVKSTAHHTPYLAKYLSLFIDVIATLVQEGKEAEALSLYASSVEKLPYISEFRKMDSLMAQLGSKLSSGNTPPSAIREPAL